jgi:Cys-rich protein (TIGR01571 family)
LANGRMRLLFGYGLLWVNVSFFSNLHSFSSSTSRATESYDDVHVYSHMIKGQDHDIAARCAKHTQFHFLCGFFRFMFLSGQYLTNGEEFRLDSWCAAAWNLFACVGWVGFVNYCLLGCSVGGIHQHNCCCACGHRRKLRLKYGLPEQPCDDCCTECCTECCCLPSSLAQQTRELKSRGVDPKLGKRKQIRFPSNYKHPLCFLSLLLERNSLLGFFFFCGRWMQKAHTAVPSPSWHGVCHTVALPFTLKSFLVKRRIMETQIFHHAKI